MTEAAQAETFIIYVHADGVHHTVVSSASAAQRLVGPQEMLIELPEILTFSFSLILHHLYL